jgi:MoxR-like ATPase
MLTDEELGRLWEHFRKSAGWDDWHKRYAAFAAWATDCSQDTLRTEESQKKLWSAKAITPVGPGDNISIFPLLGDKEAVNSIVGLREIKWPDDVAKRSAAIQNEFNQLLQFAASKGLSPKPNARLHRLFLALLPGELACTIAHDANRHASDLILGPLREGMLARQVRMRARLRAVLGQEKDLAENVRRSTFCWWLYENDGKVPVTVKPPEPPDGSQPLVLWSFAKQFMGQASIRGFSATYRAIVQAALPGLSRADLLDALRDSGIFEDVASQTVRLFITRLAGLGFLEEQNNIVAPTDDGEELLENEQSDILVERFLERVFGFAQLLQHLASHPNGSSEKDIIAALQAVYPKWTTPRTPNDIRKWSRHLGLIGGTSSSWVLTGYGAAWAARLPKQLPMPPKPDEEEQEESTDEPAPPPFPLFPAILDRFRDDPETAGLVLEDDLLASIHAAWRGGLRKRFLILAGLSGTGKTAVARSYARVVCGLMGLPLARHLKVVPVSPDWRDPSGLLGYFNALHSNPTFHLEPALVIVLQAAADPGHPYFLVLDEMNLAHVERYFAPFLSAMETGEDLALHANGEPVNGVPPSIRWPSNLHIAGTVNMDETTHPFSDKVLDRAFTIEFWDVDLKAYFERNGADDKGKRLVAVEATLVQLHDALRRVRRHFGYRTAGEVLAFMRAAPGADGEKHAVFLDQAVFSKVLPRLRGEDSAAFREALEAIGKVCSGGDLKRSRRKIEDMLASLKQTGLARFWA